MIEKHRKRIFWIIQILLTGMISTIIIVYLISNYSSTMNSISRKMNEYFSDDFNPGPPKGDYKPILTNDIIYKLKISNNIIIENENSADEKIEAFALKVYKNSNNDNSGMVDKYMYKVKRIGNNIYSIVLVENEDIQQYLTRLYISSGSMLIILIIIIFFVARKISIITVKPLENFFEKQKQFVSDVSHELKTPISIIKINAQMEEKKLGENKWNKYIQDELENMDKLVNDLLLLSKVENYENIETYKKFNLSKEIEIVLSSFETVAYEKEVNLKTEIDENINMNGSKEDIKHILSTLVDNAIKHTKKDNDVTVSLSKEKNEIILQVKNMGEPIPEEERERIFERFYRVDKARNRSEKRYGLGLAIAKSTVEKYKGTIEVKCENGITRFIVKIPLN